MTTLHRILIAATGLVLLICGGAIGGLIWFFQPNMQFIYIDDVVLWNRLRLGSTGVGLIQTTQPLEWQLTLRWSDGEQLCFKEPIEWVELRRKGAVHAVSDPNYPAGTERISWRGIQMYVLDETLRAVEINDIYTSPIQLRTKNTEEWVNFPGFGLKEAEMLFGKPDRTHSFFMH